MTSSLACLVTGAAKRVGRAIALELARRGAKHLLLHYHQSRGDADHLAKNLRRRGVRRVSLLQADLGNQDQIETLGKEALRLEPRLSGVVFSASVYDRTPFGTVTWDQWDRQLNINLKSTFFLAQFWGPAMKRAGGGRMVLIGDWSGLRPYAAYIPYCLSKTGTLYLTHALAKALGPEIQVNAVLPGPVLLPQGTLPMEAEQIRKATLLKRLGTPESVAKAVGFFLNDADYSTGAWLSVDGGRFIA